MCPDAAASLWYQSYHKMCWSMKYVGLQNVAEKRNTQILTVNLTENKLSIDKYWQYQLSI